MLFAYFLMGVCACRNTHCPRILLLFSSETLYYHRLPGELFSPNTLIDSERKRKRAARAKFLCSTRRKTELIQLRNNLLLSCLIHPVKQMQQFNPKATCITCLYSQLLAEVYKSISRTIKNDQLT